MSKNPDSDNIQDSWVRIRSGARMAVEQGAKAIRLLIGPSRVSVEASPTSERRPIPAPASTRAPITREIDKSEYRRISTPGFFRPAGLKPFLHLTNGQGGDARLRMYSDERHTRGAHLKLELVFPNGEDRTFTAEVAWVEELPRSAPARYDVGLRVLDVDAETKRLIASVVVAQGA